MTLYHVRGNMLRRQTFATTTSRSLTYFPKISCVAVEIFSSPTDFFRIAMTAKALESLKRNVDPG